MEQKDSVYLPNLNGIRAIAASIVLCWHIYQFFPLFGLSGKHNPVASVGVTLFFVLSGFLITFLLLREKEKYGDINVKHFYIRRILRIWPLYYLAIVLSLILLPFLNNIDAPTELFIPYLSYFLLFPNLPFIFHTSISLLTPLWSIGIEEQFYAFWPWVIKKSKNLFWVIIFFGCLFLLPKLYFRFTEQETWFSYFFSSRIQCMALGAYAALWLQSGQPLRKMIYHPAVQLICWLFLLYSAVFGAVPLFSALLHELYALTFFVIILNVATNPRTIVNLEFKPLYFIGEISYGIYVYHMFVIIILAHFLKRYFVNSLFDKILIYAMVISVTLLVAWLSYRFFEMPFLRKKDQFSRIVSRRKV